MSEETAHFHAPGIRALRLLYAVGLLGVLALGGVWMASVYALERDAALRREHLAELAHVRRVEDLLADAERLQRGYLLTERQELEDRFAGAVLELEDTLVGLQAATADDPTLHAEVELLDELFRQRVSLLYRVLEGAESGGVQSVAELVTEGHALMVRAEGQAARAAQILERRVAADDATLAGRSTWARWIAATLALLGAAFLGVSYVTTMRHLAARDRARTELEGLAAGLESRVAERTAALETANRELHAALQDMEAFSYSVSHDLRAPLRALDAQAVLLSEEALDAEGVRGASARMRAAVGRITAIIDGLLELSRAARKELVRERVDVTAAAREILDDLARAEPSRAVEVSVGEGVEVWGDAALLRLLLVNVLGNAWKYTGRAEHARVQVAALRDDVGAGFVVRDNGAGFDMRHADRLFEPFQRLHSTAEFPGTGIGLAIVRRIVQRHGGRIWVEAAPGLGAAFYVVLPDERHTRR